MPHLASMIASLPCDIQWKIYHTYFSTYVLLDIKERASTLALTGCNDTNDSPLCGMWRQTFLHALSNTKMYDQGKLDITRLCIKDRQCVYSELVERHPQIQMHAGRTYITTQDNCKNNLISYKKDANDMCPRMFMGPSGKYVIVWPPSSGYPSARRCLVAWDHLTQPTGTEVRE
jgi:hypothetical protein